MPDLYQGSELWDLSLVDPDNRRPVDFDHRGRLLAGSSEADPAAARAAEDGLGRSKLLVVWRAPAGPAAPTPPASAIRVPTSRSWRPAPPATTWVGFVRGGRVITVAPRLPIGLERMGGWGRHHDPAADGLFHNRLGEGPRAWSRQVGLADLLGAFPVALLVAE